MIGEIAFQRETFLTLLNYKGPGHTICIFNTYFKGPFGIKSTVYLN